MTDTLTPEEFGRLSAIFGEVRQVSIAQREPVLAEFRTRERPEVARALDAMLAADADETPSLLDTPMCSLSGLGVKQRPEPLPPARIGAFEIEREIGEGAFGTVYLGIRREPFEQRVAVKVLHIRRGGARVLKWFQREIEALSKIEHPGVAGILDAGLTEAGQPYLVTEFVEGAPIDRYCREYNLSLSARLGLIAQLCDTVQHAHQRAVVHRDLKPTNVLVSARDGEPMVRVIDFGTAKLLEPTGGVTDTLSASLVGTPGYLSPEQIVGGAIDARTDVYAIGVLLAEVITGKSIGVWTPKHEVKDSSRVESLRSFVGPRRRDIEHIVRTTTAIDQEKRYPSAAHIGDDLRAYLARQPLPGRSRSPFHAATCYARRHPFVTAVSLLLVAAVAVQSVRASVASFRLTRELQTQQHLVTGTLTDVVEQLGHLIGTAESRRALITSLLERAHALERSNPDDPELGLAIARLLAAQADLALEEGDVDLAGTLRREVLDRMDGLVERLPPEVSTVRWHAEVTIKLGDVFKQTGDRPVAEALYEQALSMQEAALARFPDARIQLLDDICWSLERLVDWSKLLENLAQANELSAKRLQLAELLLSLDPTRVLSHHNLASAESKAWRVAGASADNASAAAHAERAVMHARYAAEAEPGRLVFQISLIHNLSCAGQSQAALGNPDASDQRLSAALSAVVALLHNNPDDLTLRASHVSTLAALAIVASHLKNHDEFFYWYNQCIIIVNQYGGTDSMPPPIQAVLRSMMVALGKAQSDDWNVTHP